MRTRLLSLLALTALLGTGCGDLFDPAAAVVDGHKITVERVEDALAAFESTEQFARLAEQGEPSALKRQIEQNYLSQLIRSRVLRAQAEILGVEVSEDEVEERLESIRSEFESEDAFREEL